MRTPHIMVNDIGDIFFIDEEGITHEEPCGSFESKHYISFRLIEDACSNYDQAKDQRDELVKALTDMINVMNDGEWGTHEHARADRNARDLLAKVRS